MQILSLALLLAASLTSAAPVVERSDEVSLFTRMASAFAAAEAAQHAPGLVTRQSSDTRNDLINGMCNDIILIYARGTNGSGNIGTGIGTAFADELAKAEPGRVIVQGVQPYAATVDGYFAGGDEQGADSMASLTQRAATQCPNAKIVWGGYSQGAQVNHKAAARLAAGLENRIYAIALFGDPDNQQPFPGTLNTKWRTWCHTDDPICAGQPLPVGGHLTYDKDAPEAAAWVASRV
ncbi:cutinase-domain-containing protein [Pyronema domesticum]|nr:cutinase-domain-containing protein [Pyronema domesticum]